MKKYGLIGRTLGHSFSKSFFQDYFLQQDVQALYENVELEDISEVKKVLPNNFSGLNVTIPYKETIIPYLDELNESASEVGAVNCIEFKEGKVIGHNTDAFGFHQSIKPFLTNKHERAMIIGTGGASKAVAYVFKQLGIDVIYISRNPVGDLEFGYEDINEHMLRACKVVVNCTPVGTFPNVEELIDLPYDYVTDEHMFIDLIYNPAKTRFLEEAEKRGADILNGEAMLRHQALKSWEIWNK